MMNGVDVDLVPTDYTVDRGDSTKYGITLQSRKTVLDNRLVIDQMSRYSRLMKQKDEQSKVPIDHEMFE